MRMKPPLTCFKGRFLKLSAYIFGMRIILENFVVHYLMSCI